MLKTVITLSVMAGFAMLSQHAWDYSHHGYSEVERNSFAALVDRTAYRETKRARPRLYTSAERLRAYDELFNAGRE